MSTALGPDVGRELLDDLGFLLVPGPPTAVGRSYLFVAIRPEPTLRHFDPERVDFWATPAGHGLPAGVEWATREPPAGEYSWGPIRVVDRVNAANEFASFGGEVVVARLPQAKIIVFSSDAPIVACGGHSQEWAAWGREIEGFLARLRAAADPRGPLEAKIAGLSPMARYAAFIEDTLTRRGGASEQLLTDPMTLAALSRERARLKEAAAAEWAAGVGLLRKVLE